MQVIGHLIRFDAYQAGLDFVQSTGKGGNIHLGKMLGERFSYSGILALPVWLGTSNGILPETGLGFVCSHRSASGNRRTHKCWRRALLVKCMASFVNSRHDRGLDKAFIRIDSKAHIKWAAKARGKRMWRLGNLAP